MRHIDKNRSLLLRKKIVMCSFRRKRRQTNARAASCLSVERVIGKSCKCWPLTSKVQNGQIQKLLTHTCHFPWGFLGLLSKRLAFYCHTHFSWRFFLLLDAALKQEQSHLTCIRPWRIAHIKDLKLHCDPVKPPH